MIPVRVSMETDTWHVAEEGALTTLCGREPENIGHLVPVATVELPGMNECRSCSQTKAMRRDSLDKPEVELEQMRYEYVALDRLVKNERNPNVMGDREFNALVEAIEEEGFIEPLQVVPVDGDRYEIVGGHHRFDAARHLAFASVPCVILDPEKFDEDRRNWNLVKLNIVRGKLNPEKFTRLYEEMSERYEAEALQALMGFTTEDAFRRMYKSVRDQLPEDLRSKLDDTREEIKTIDDLSLVLNKLFAEYGDTLPSNMMVFSWGGKEVLWVKTSTELWKRVKQLASETAKADGDFADTLYELLKKTD